MGMYNYGGAPAGAGFIGGMPGAAQGRLSLRTLRKYGVGLGWYKFQNKKARRPFEPSDVVVAALTVICLYIMVVPIVTGNCRRSTTFLFCIMVVSWCSCNPTIKQIQATTYIIKSRRPWSVGRHTDPTVKVMYQIN